jgi:hypothetical protein
VVARHGHFLVVLAVDCLAVYCETAAEVEGCPHWLSTVLGLVVANRVRCNFLGTQLALELFELDFDG